MNPVIINLWYVVAAALFIFGLKQLGSPATAVRGNVLSSLAMVIAIAVTLFNKEILTFELIVIAAVIGAVIGAIAAQKVEMTSMPEMVALFNGSGGIASLMVGWAALYNVGNTTFTDVTVLLSIVIGGMTFSGSILAWGKLGEVMTSAAVVFGAQRIVNAGILVGLVVLLGSVLHGSGSGFPLFICGNRPVTAVWRDGGAAYWRRRHASGDLPAQQLFRPGCLCCGFCHQQQYLDRRRLHGWRSGHHPD